MSSPSEEDENGTKNTKEEDVDEDFRVYSILAYFVVLVVFGLPIWWYTTRVYRANLPMDRMYKGELINRTDNEFGMPLSLEYDILISFVHPDPGGLEIDLNGEDIDINLQPFLKKISPIASFFVKSQWLYFTELGAIPTKILEEYTLQENQLPHIITPLETKLWSHLSSRPTLNLVVYFSRCSMPLYLYNRKKERVETNSFLSPRWGGIFIYNADINYCEKKKIVPDLQQIVSTFVTQLKYLFNIDSLNEDEIYELKNRKAYQMLYSTRRTLKSLAQLLSEIGSIVISDEVGEKINVAVNNADLSEEFLKKGEVDNGLEYAKIAFLNSEAAFSDPSLLALLYFPEDQKYAVYIPLFLPIMIPVFMSLTVLRKWKKIKKQKIE